MHHTALRGLLEISFAAAFINSTNTPHFANPGANVSNVILNLDGSVRSLGGFSQINSTTTPSGLIEGPAQALFSERWAAGGAATPL